MKPMISLLLAVPLLWGCGESSSRNSQADEDQVNAWKEELISADELFANTVAREGFSVWSSFFSPEGSVIREGTGEIRGIDAVQASMDAATASGGLISLTWSPERAEVSNAGDLGYTVGRYRSTGIGLDGVKVASTGIYVSIWRRQEGGGWKVVMDLGNALTPPEALDPQEGPQEAAGGGT